MWTEPMQCRVRKKKNKITEKTLKDVKKIALGV